MLTREFAFLRVKKQVLASWEFPIGLDETRESPMAGSFDAKTMAKLDRAVGHFPFAARAGDGRKAWRLDVPGRGSVDVWLTSDGSIFLRGDVSLNVVYTLYVHLLEAFGEIAVEDRITGMVHDRRSLLRLVRRDEARTPAKTIEVPAFQQFSAAIA